MFYVCCENNIDILKWFEFYLVFVVVGDDIMN